FDPTSVRSFRTNSAVVDYNNYALANGYTGGGGVGPYVNLATTPLGMSLDDAGVSAYPMLNTTLFGTHSIQSQDRRQVFANGHYDLFGKEVQLFGQFLFANTESVGALAPSPVISLLDPTANIFVPGANVFNPFQIDLGPGAA